MEQPHGERTLDDAVCAWLTALNGCGVRVRVYVCPCVRALLQERFRSADGGDASCLVPLGGLKLVKGLMQLSNGRLLLLAGDKGYNAEVDMKGLRDPHIARHGSFSMMVNFHAVGCVLCMCVGACCVCVCVGWVLCCVVLGGCCVVLCCVVMSCTTWLAPACTAVS